MRWDNRIRFFFFGRRTLPQEEQVLESPGVEAPHEGQDVWPGIFVLYTLSVSLLLSAL